jgi:hypothetical protein
MTNLRSIALAIAFAALVAAPRAQADRGGEWTSDYGMIFTVPNLFGSNQANVLDDFGGGIGLQKNLGPQRALRFSVRMSRASNPAYERESTNLLTGDVTTTFVGPGAGSYTSRYDVGLGTAYVMRLTPAALSPYFGFGGGFGYVQEAREFEDTTGATLVRRVDDLERRISLNANGMLGVEWRVHRSVSLFAEYGLGVALVTFVSDKDETRYHYKSDGSLASGTKADGSYTKFFNFGTGIGQGGQLGLLAYF